MDISLPALVSILALVILVGISCVNEDLNVGFLGIAFGIVLQQAGFNFIWAFCISLFLYAGSMQFVLVPLLASAASPLTVAVTTLFVNSRHVFYGLSFI